MPATTAVYPELVEGLPHTFACSTIGPAGLNLRRLAGVNEPLTSGEWEPAAEVLSAAKDLLIHTLPVPRYMYALTIGT
jgi:hypothetical protein